MDSSRLCLGTNWREELVHRGSNPRGPLTLSMGHSEMTHQDVGLSTLDASPLKNPLNPCGCAAASEGSHLNNSQDLISKASSFLSMSSENRYSLPLFLNHEVSPPTQDARKADFLHPLSFQGTAEEHCQLQGNSDDILYRRSHVSGVPGNTSQDLFSDDPWRTARLSSQVASHPLFENLLAAHVACLRAGTPVDRSHIIEEQLANRHEVAARYAMLERNVPPVHDNREDLDHFMVSYILLLQTFREQLREHMHVHAEQALASCWELEKEFVSLTGVTLGKGTGESMSDDENELGDRYTGSFHSPLANLDGLGLGPLTPSDAERTLMENVRQELKIELKQNYRSKLSEVREEILRKRRAGKLPGNTTSVMKEWWNAHSRWPYPTEGEKLRMVQETGLELKQINNWFINQRKRNWHSQSSSTAAGIDNHLQRHDPKRLNSCVWSHIFEQ